MVVSSVGVTVIQTAGPAWAVIGVERLRLDGQPHAEVDDPVRFRRRADRRDGQLELPADLVGDALDQVVDVDPDRHVPQLRAPTGAGHRVEPVLPPVQHPCRRLGGLLRA